MNTRAGARARTDRGISESVQWAVLAPVLLFIVIGAIQLAMILHARSVVAQAALAGAESGAAAGSDAGAGAARRVATSSGLQDVSVAVTASGGNVQVAVHGRAASLLPGLGAVSASATSPVER